MTFSSPLFLFFFFPLFFLCFYLSPSRIFRLLVLVVFSFGFYFWGEGSFLLVLVVSSLLDFILARLISADQANLRKQKFLVALSIIVNLSVLAYFKYCSFFVSELVEAFPALLKNHKYLLEISLPLGISFFTFQSISYVVDVARGKVEACRNPIEYFAFIFMFPQLVAGPIVRYDDIKSDFKSLRRPSLDNLYEGIRRFLIGFAKKTLLANSLAPVVVTIFSLPQSELTMGLAWLGALCFAFQIFFDFSGYSDMAIGVGLMLGLKFPENFNYPYKSFSIRDFWTKWHITLSQWFRDYLYIPLGGGRRSKSRVYLNLMIVFILCGLWHGANWTFIIWGLYHGLFLIAERMFSKGRVKASWLGYIYSFLVVTLGWVVFRCESFSEAVVYYSKMFSFDFTRTEAIIYDINGKLYFVIALSIIFSFGIYKKLSARISTNPGYIAFENLSLLLLFILGYSSVFIGTDTPFLYFRF